MISFYGGERAYGADAYNLLTRRPDLTYARATTLLGRGLDHPAVGTLQEGYFPMKLAYNSTSGGLMVQHKASVNDGGHGLDYFTPEELVAMVLVHAKDITKQYGGSYVHDAVLVAPAFYTQLERQALIDAADLADIRVLSLMDENAAAALIFGIDNVYENPTNFLFYNLGASCLQVRSTTTTGVWVVALPSPVE